MRDRLDPKKEAEAIRLRLGEFLSQNLKLTLSEEKTFITNAGIEKAKFLGYEMGVTGIARPEIAQK